MLPRYRYGLIVGGIGLFLNVCVSALFGFCGPVATLVAGGIAGFLAARDEKAPTKGGGAQIGAVSGAIAGGLMLLGQLCGGVLSLIGVQAMGIRMFGQLPPDLDSGSATAIYYGTGIGLGLCLGIAGVLLSGLAGGAAGYLGTSDTPTPVATPDPNLG